MIQVIKILVQLSLAIPELIKITKEVVSYFKQKELEKKVQKAMDADKKNNNTSSVENIINK